MSSVQTALVLGAGASVPYGLPTAATLKQQICKNPPRLITNDLLDQELIDQHVDQLASSLKGSGLSSIDRFLEHQPDFERVGKRCIVDKLLSAELDAVHNGLVATDWNEWLYQGLLARGGLRQSGISVVTFNYDRTFEYGLAMMFMNTFGRTFEDAMQVVRSLPIMHVYGSLEFKYALQPRRQQSPPKIRPVDVERAAEGIRIMSADRQNDNDKVTGRAAEVVLAADRIVFLGFGFDETNLARIGVRSDSAAWTGRNREIFGTAYGMLRGERNRVQRLIGTPIELGGEADDCLTFLRGTFGTLIDDPVIGS